MNGQAMRAGAACAAVAFAAGCVSGGVYPNAWAEKQEVGSAGCPVIDGEYLNEGEYFEKVDDDGLVRHTMTFSDSFGCKECPGDELAPGESFGCMECFGDEQTPIPEVAAVTSPYERFSLRLVDKTLHIRATAADGSTRSFEETVRTSCRDSMMLVGAEWWSSLEEEEGQEMFGATLGMSILARGSLKLGRAEDGSLLVRQSATGSLLLFYWPILPMSFSEWVRFPPAATTPAAEATAPVLVSQVSVPEETPPEGR